MNCLRSSPFKPPPPPPPLLARLRVAGLHLFLLCLLSCCGFLLLFAGKGAAGSKRKSDDGDYGFHLEFSFRGWGSVLIRPLLQVFVKKRLLLTVDEISHTVDAA
jgi:hypothetical protein